MRLRDLRWYILACVILLISYGALAFCFYLPIRAKTVESMQILAQEAVNNDITIAQNEVESYYQRFMNGNFSGLETDFNKTSYKTKMQNKDYLIGTGNEFLGDNSQTLYVFFCNHETEEVDLMGAYIPLNDILSFSSFDVVLFTETFGIKYNSITTSSVGTMSNLLDDDSFSTKFIEGWSETGYSKVYNIEKVEGILSVNQFLGYYYSVFISLDAAFFSINWILIQAVIFYFIGVLFAIAMILILVFGCRKASVMLRVDRHAVETTNAIIIRVKKDGKIIFANTTFKKLFNLKELPDIKDFIEVSSGKPIFNFFRKKKTIQCFYTFEEKTHYFQLTPIGVLSTYYLVGSDITEEFLRIQTLEMMNGKNEYTGCNNNFSLCNMFPSIIATATTDLAFVEFNIFKSNDIISLFGLDSFSILLKKLLEMIQNQFEGNMIYQIRDEKFLIIYPNLDVKDVLNSIKKTMEVLRRPLLIKTNNIYVRCKVVVYNLPLAQKEQVSLDQIKHCLNLAYTNILGFQEKDVNVYTEAMEGVLTAEATMEVDLQEAIANDDFEMYLQPQFELASNRIVGFESLIRWNNPKYANRSSQTFIELAEQRGYILDISRFVIRETFRLAKLLESFEVTISLNLSPIQILQVGFVNDLISQFDQNQLKKGSIALEITETFLMENFQLVNEKLKILKKAGFKIHLDDFCTGYSSMAYLKDLPIDTIKIDYEFTRYVDTNKVNYSIISCICTLAKELGLSVICEGVETNAQRDVVKKLGCRIIQGFLIGKAMPYQNALEVLKQANQKKGEKR